MADALGGNYSFLVQQGWAVYMDDGNVLLDDTGQILARKTAIPMLDSDGQFLLVQLGPRVGNGYALYTADGRLLLDENGKILVQKTGIRITGIRLTPTVASVKGSVTVEVSVSTSY
jgi:hypothetical protein